MGEIKNLNLVNVSVTGYSNVGGLVGKVYDLDGVFGLVSKCSSTGDINGLGYHTGGLVGASSGIIEKSFSKGTVTGRNTVGGLVAYLEVDGNLSNSYSQADVLGIDGIPYIPVSAVGGLVGYSEDVDINNSYSTGVVSIETSEPSYDIGGLVGRISFGVNVSNSYYSDNSGQSDTGKGTKVEDYRMTWSSTYLTRGWNLLSTSGFEMYPKLGWEVGITNYIWWMTEPY
jgi:hypothetical protein